MGADALSAGAVARRLGVAVTTLRTWHQRYGLGPSEHVPGHHRRYNRTDLARLEIMRRLTADGVSPAEAANWARRADVVPGAEPAWPAALAAAAEPAIPGSQVTAGSGSRVIPAEPAARAEPATPAAPAARAEQATPARDGGGATIGVGRAGGPPARGLARAAMRLDTTAMSATLRRAIDTDGVVTTWDGLLRPVLAGIGERHAATAALVEVEHLLSRCASEALAGVPRPVDGEPARVLLACADEEQHSLPLEALAAALAERGVGCRLLGPRVPVAALLEVVRRTGPAVVALWSHAPATGDPVQLDALLSARRRPLLVLAAGPGWPAGPLPRTVARPAGLAEAVSLITTVVAPLAME